MYFRLHGGRMDITEFNLLEKAKRQLAFIRAGTIVAVALWLGSLLASMLLTGPYHQLAVSLSYGSLLGALLLNADFTLSSSVITRADLIRVIEAQVNRDPAALTYLAGGKVRAADA
jgi:hypothetical protein